MITLVYRGPAALVGALAALLRAEGIDADYEPPMEGRSAAHAATEVLLYVVDHARDGLTDYAIVQGLDRGMARFRARFGAAAQVEIRPDDESDDQA